MDRRPDVGLAAVTMDGMAPNERLAEVARREAASDAEAIVASVLRRIGRLKRPTPGASFLDIGCGGGTNASVLASRGFYTIGVDVVSEFITLAQASHPGVRFVVSAAEDLPFNDETFDYVVLLSVLEHVRDWRKTLAEAVRVLKPGGVLYASTTNRFCPRQHEIRYIWGFGYLPAPFRRAIYFLAMRYRPGLVHYTDLPAYHWFSYNQLARELRKLCTEPYHWLSLLHEDEIPARYRRPVLFRLVRLALKHPVAATCLLAGSTTLVAEKKAR
jgi:ubiquinone/menaquinone biosynthesis C-methylase UbiE